MKTARMANLPVWVGHRNQLVVKLWTDGGIVGWGKSGSPGRERAVAGDVSVTDW